MKELKISDIVEAFKSLKIKSPIISVDKDFITLDTGNGWLITNKEKFFNYLEKYEKERNYNYNYRKTCRCL